MLRKALLRSMMPEQNPATTEQIWRELSDRLRQFVRARVDCHADVDDIVQTVFLRIHTKAAELRDAQRLEAWVFQITRNAINDYYRKQRVTDGEVETLPDDSEPENQNANFDISQCLTALIERLPEDQRHAVSLYELDGLPQKEIAARKSISLSGAKSRIQRGRKSLEAMLLQCCQFQLDNRGNVLDYEAKDSGGCGQACG